MKSLEQLGISPAPWEILYDEDGSPYGIDCTRPAGMSLRVVDDLDGISDADARLIGSAPELYECLREATEDACQYCKYETNCDRTVCHNVVCMKWRAALANAAGESEVRDE